MKSVNILSIIEAYRKLSNTLFQKLMNSYGIISGIKDYELNGIESFVNELLKIKNNIYLLNTILNFSSYLPLYFRYFLEILKTNKI